MQIWALSSKSFQLDIHFAWCWGLQGREGQERADDEREPWAPREAALANHSPPSLGSPTPSRRALTALSAPKPGIRPDVLEDWAGSSLGIESGSLQEKRRAPSLPSEFRTTGFPQSHTHFWPGLTTCLESSQFHNMLAMWETQVRTRYCPIHKSHEAQRTVRAIRWRKSHSQPRSPGGLPGGGHWRIRRVSTSRDGKDSCRKQLAQFGSTAFLIQAIFKSS